MTLTRSKARAIIDGLVTLRKSATDEQALTSVGVYPEWKTVTEYEVGMRITYNGILYKCLQSHTSQDTWNPVDAVSLWAKVLIPDETTIPEWEQPDSTNPYTTGDKVMHNGSIWESTCDNNVWEPGVYGWTEIIE